MMNEYQRIKNEKGITMAVLVITVLLLMIVTASLATHSYDSVQLSHLTKLDNDIETLNNRVAAYYVENGKLPILGDPMTKEDVSNYIAELSRNDGETYYIIDLGELDNITLNYGKGYLSRSTDTYIINEESHIVYYLKGIYYDDEMHYTVGNYQAVVLDKEDRPHSSGAKRGDYVAYIPTSSVYTVEAFYSGSEENQTFKTQTDLKWQIYDVDSKVLTLISNKPMTETLDVNNSKALQDTREILDYTCMKLYSNYELNATAGTSQTISSDTYNIRPIVEIPLDYVNFAKEGTGSPEDPWSLDAENKPNPGDYVAYYPTKASYEANKAYTGYDSSNSSASTGNTDQNFETEDVNWKIFKIDKDKITLISTDIVNRGFYLQGADGYNNAVYLLNEACNKLYSNSSYKATARSINAEDIESISSYDKTSYTGSGYGKEQTPTNTSYTYYPNIFKAEIVANVDGSGYGVNGSLNESKQDNLITGSTKGNTLKLMFSYYTYTMSKTYMSDTYLGLITYKENSKENLTYYSLASRAIPYYSGYAHYTVRGVGSGLLFGYDKYLSNGDSLSGSSALRPIVEIPLSSVDIGRAGEGTSTSKYSLTKI